MLKSPGIWYLATLFASLGLLSVIALDALRSRSNDHVLTRKLAIPGGTRSKEAPVPQTTETRQADVDPSLSPVIRAPPFSADDAAAAASARPASVPTPPPAPASAPLPQPTAPWISVTVTEQIAESPDSPLSRYGSKLPKHCLALWDRETHMTKDEWRAACGRIPGNP
jgi:hypothetical protein